MDTVWLQLVFDSTFELLEVKFGSSEKFKPNGLRLVHFQQELSLVHFSQFDL